MASLNVGNLIVRDSTSLGFFRQFLPLMVKDSAPSVRVCVAETLLQVLRHDQDLAVKLFLNLCDTDERLLKTSPVNRFLQYSAPTHYSQLEPLLTRMVNSADGEVAQHASIQICLSSLDNEAALPLSHSCIDGSTELRLGAAQVFATNFKLAEFRIRCEEMLVSFFSDTDAPVRREAARCFYKIEGNELEAFLPLAEAFMDSFAFRQEYHAFFTALKKSEGNLPDTILKACELLIEIAEENSSNLEFGSSISDAGLVSLILRIYSNAEDDETKCRCLDLIDTLTLRGAFGLEQEVAAFDR